MEKMKIKIPSLLAILAVLFLLIGCDKIEEPFLKPIGINEPEPLDTIAFDTVRTVLLEDYTGHQCPNCPEAAEVAHNLSQLYGDRLVLLTVHAGHYSEAEAEEPFTYDFRTPEGTAMHDFFGFFFYPVGMVNRAEYGGNRMIIKDDWENAVAEIIDDEPQALIEIQNDYAASTRVLKCKVSTLFLENLEGTYYISVVLTESGIVKPQETSDGVSMDYVHNHVLRTSLNGTWGLPVGQDGGAVGGVVHTNGYELTLNAEFIPENCAVVAFVYNNENNVVIQAAEAPVIQQ
jgi:hypothetical protein